MAATWYEVRPDRLRRDGGLRRRAFRGDGDLSLWVEADGGVVRWQFAWSAPREPQRIVEWADGALSTGEVLEDDRAFSMHKGAPIVRRDAAPDAGVVTEARARLRAAAAALPTDVAAAVLAGLGGR